MISIRETNQQLSKGILPSSLDHGFIPSADKLEECLRRHHQSGHFDQADILIEELKTLTPQDSSPSTIYCTDDYDDFEFGEAIYYQKKVSNPSTFKKKLIKMKSKFMVSFINFSFSFHITNCIHFSQRLPYSKGLALLFALFITNLIYSFSLFI